jgi:hypothetical protein
MKEKIRRQIISTLVDIINKDIEYNLLSKEFAAALEKEHRRLLRLVIK